MGPPAIPALEKAAKGDAKLAETVGEIIEAIRHPPGGLPVVPPPKPPSE